MAANNLDSISNGDSHLLDPILAGTELMSYDFSLGALAPKAATYTNCRPVLEQPAIPPQPAKTLSRPKPVSDPSALPNASDKAPKKR